MAANKLSFYMVAFLLKNKIPSMLLFTTTKSTKSTFLNHLNILDLSFQGQNILTECLCLGFCNINCLSH